MNRHSPGGGAGRCIRLLRRHRRLVDSEEGSQPMIGHRQRQSIDDLCFGGTITEPTVVILKELRPSLRKRTAATSASRGENRNLFVSSPRYPLTIS
jgi:hypothetical protein